MSYRKETATRYYYAWIGHPTQWQAEKEADIYRAEGYEVEVSYDNATNRWWAWRWHDKVCTPSAIINKGVV